MGRKENLMKEGAHVHNAQWESARPNLDLSEKLSEARSEVSN